MLKMENSYSLSHNFSEFVMYRNKDNLNRPVFIIFSQDLSTISTIIDYLVLWINKPIKKIKIDVLNKFNGKEINNQNMYIYNMTSSSEEKITVNKNESVFLNTDCNTISTSHICDYMIRNSGPMIFVINKTGVLPTKFNTISNSMFIDMSNEENVKHLKQLLNISVTTGGGDQFNKTKNEVLVLDHMNCSTKISVLNNIF